MRIVDVITKSGVYEPVTTYNIEDFPYDNIHKLKLAINHKKDVSTYCIAFGAFDIETTTIQPYDDSYTDREVFEWLRGQKIKVPEGITDFKEIRKQYKKFIKLSTKEGQPIDVFYQECNELFPYWFPEVIYNEEDELYKILDIIDKNKPIDVLSKPYGFMYHWQICLDGYVCTGRYWSEFVTFFNRIVELLKLDEKNRLVIYVHNLSYEHQFMRNFLRKYFGGYTIFAPQERKPIRIACKNGIEFRCSYKLTNMTLAKATMKELGVKYIKADGDLDYSLLRTPETEMNDKEFGYCVSDVLSLWDFIGCRLRNDKDNLESIPMTSTGYVRRCTRKECKKDKDYRDKVFYKTRMTEDVFILLNEAARGGNTHANRYLAGKLLKLADSYDVSSSYPAQMVLHDDFPMGKFQPYGNPDTLAEFERLTDQYACIFRITITKPKCKGFVPMPYIPTAKCLKRAGRCIFDNGRILSCDGYITMSVTEVDYRIIKSQYDYDDIYITDLYISERGPLPEPIRRVVMEYFTQKCTLKYDGDHCVESEKEMIDYLYGKKKNELNGIFGMAYTSPVRDIITEADDGSWTTTPANIAEALNKFYNSRNSFLCYAWGVYVCAFGREWLERLINAAGDTCAYCDTDSAKGYDLNEEAIECLNAKIRQRCEEVGGYVDYKGIRYYLGVYEKETAKEQYQEFITLGAKKYAYTDSKGLHLTVAGVNKKEGAKEMKTINNFKVGFVFRRAGGKTLYYNDETDIYNITVEGCTFETSSNIGMVESTYTLGITGDYADLIEYKKFID